MKYTPTILLVTPGDPDLPTGNRTTAMRWAGILKALGHRPRMVQEYGGQDCSILIALHALKSHDSIKRFRRDHPDRPLVVALTGTDVYRDIQKDRRTVESLELADRLVVLQKLAIDELPKKLRQKARVIHQSMKPHGARAAKRTDTFDVCVLGHLRPVKDPFRTAEAARLLPRRSRIRIVHVGGVVSDEMERELIRQLQSNDRYRWLGALSRSNALGCLARSRLLSLTSLSEGGANVISEAIMADVPVISSKISGSVGLLGKDYPGYFPVGDTQALADLLLRAEQDEPFYQKLKSRCRRRRPLFEPAAEKAAWKKLLAELEQAYDLFASQRRQ